MSSLMNEASSPRPAEGWFERLRSHAGAVVVDVWAPWCMPCRVLTPVLDRVGEDYAGRVAVWKVNADEEPEVAIALGVRGIPTLIAFRDEQEVGRQVGLAPERILRELFETAVAA